MTKFLSRGLAAMLLFWAGITLQAQERPPVQAPGAEQAPITDAELKSFAKAYVEFEKIRAQYEPKVTASDSEQEKEKVREEAVAKLNQALEKEGLTMERYSVIFHRVNADQALREKVLRWVEAERRS